MSEKKYFKTPNNKTRRDINLLIQSESKISLFFRFSLKISISDIASWSKIWENVFRKRTVENKIKNVFLIPC